ncbi:hypothetical protein BT69DRAFT_1072867 [Atractiella rhizophila]|nr:hypothetical protein BT69DRAFT_1072867 [Atractiella rhizophila]
MDQEAYRTLRELEMRLLEIEDLKRKRERDIIAAIQRKKSKSKPALVPQTPASHRKVHFDLSSSTPELSSASVSESEESSSLSEDYNEPDLSQAYDVLGANSAILAAQLRGEEPYYFDNQELLARYLSKSNLNKEELNRILAENGLDVRSPLTPRPSIRTAPLTSLSARPTPQHRNSTTPQMSALHPSSTTPRMSQLTPRPSRVLQTPVIDSSLPSLTTDFVHLQEIRRRQTQSAHPTPRIRVRSNSTPHPVNRMPRRDGEEMLKQMLAEEKKDLEFLEREQLEMQIKELERIEKERTANLIARMRGYEQLKRISTPKVPNRAQFHRTSNPW